MSTIQHQHRRRRFLAAGAALTLVLLGACGDPIQPAEEPPAPPVPVEPATPRIPHGDPNAPRPV